MQQGNGQIAAKHVGEPHAHHSRAREVFDLLDKAGDISDQALTRLMVTISSNRTNFLARIASNTLTLDFVEGVLLGQVDPKILKILNDKNGRINLHAVKGLIDASSEDNYGTDAGPFHYNSGLAGDVALNGQTNRVSQALTRVRDAELAALEQSFANIDIPSGRSSVVEFKDLAIRQNPAVHLGPIHAAIQSMSFVSLGNALTTRGNGASRAEAREAIEIGEIRGRG